MNIDRRQFFAGSAAVLGSLAAGGCNIVAANKVDAAKSSHRSDRKRTLRLAHMTDIHLNEERNAERGFQAALEHIHNLDDPPELIVTGGDLIMDALDKDAQAAHAQWDLFDAVLSRHCQIPVKHCLGNHDGWGLYLDESSRKGEDPSMDMAIERLGLPGRYYSYEVGGWKFIHLDSTRMQTQKKSYLAKLDDEQYEWLNQQLASSDGRPVVIISHRRHCQRNGVNCARCLYAPGFGGAARDVQRSAQCQTGVEWSYAPNRPCGYQADLFYL
jgi:predicted MPP superfamily phosphohydrolase